MTKEQYLRILRDIVRKRGNKTNEVLAREIADVNYPSRVFIDLGNPYKVVFIVDTVFNKKDCTARVDFHKNGKFASADFMSCLEHLAGNVRPISYTYDENIQTSLSECFDTVTDAVHSLIPVVFSRLLMRYDDILITCNKLSRLRLWKKDENLENMNLYVEVKQNEEKTSIMFDPNEDTFNICGSSSNIAMVLRDIQKAMEDHPGQMEEIKKQLRIYNRAVHIFQSGYIGSILKEHGVKLGFLGEAIVALGLGIWGVPIIWTNFVLAVDDLTTYRESLGEGKV